VLLFARSARGEAGAKGLGRAAALFALARRRVAAAAAELGVDLVVVGPASGEANSPDGELAPGCRFLLQHGATFAERLANAFGAVRALGYGEVVAVPTDVPLLGVRHLAAAFDALSEGAGAVLGPSPDGGVYLIGVRGDARPLLSGVRWRTARVLADLSANAAAADSGAPVLLDRLGDVDREADLRRLARELATAPALDPELTRLVALLLAATAVQASAGPCVGRERALPCLPSRAPPAPAVCA
jgi:glycosyltransferase A (GT-A) superfamily protein (DUF2064 family)